jgi:tRNA(adenine34) deaminase
MSSLRLTPSPEITAIDRAMMERALELADQAAAIDEVPVGAVVYRGNKIIAEGYNLREASSDPVAHAELLAISRAGRALKTWRLSDCSLAVTLEPCPMCAGAIVNARVGRVIYGARDPKAGACHSLYRIPNDNRLNHEALVMDGLMAERCGQVLKDFFRRKRESAKARRAPRSA